uniref:Solute carrier family 19 member 2 n=1 Tax=Labrus bergylta TaxID=56723 RepID=A0A3Q3F9V6_9LABR
EDCFITKSRMFPTLVLSFFNLAPKKRFSLSAGCERDLSIWTYSYLALLFPIFLARTTLRHYVMLLKAQGMLVATTRTLQRGGAAHYQRVTGSAAPSSVRIGGGISDGQLLLSVAKLSCCTRHHQLTAAAWPSSSLLVSAMPKRSLFFHKSPGSAEEGQKGGSAPCWRRLTISPVRDVQIQVFKMIFLILSLQEFVSPLLAWSLWWALSTCGYFQILNYAQRYKCLCTSSGALAALLVGYLPVSWSLWGAGSVCHVLAAYMLLITVATSQQFNMQRYALVFGVNTFMALLLQTLLTLVVVDSVGFGLDVFTQFLLYGGYFTLIAVVFLLAGSLVPLTVTCTSAVLCRRRKPHESSPQSSRMQTEFISLQTKSVLQR